MFCHAILDDDNGNVLRYDVKGQTTKANRFQCARIHPAKIGPDGESLVELVRSIVGDLE
jgi:hypothetical protein